MHLIGRSSCLALVVLSLAGCPSDPAVPANVPIAMLPSVLAPAVCDVYHECGGEAADLFFGAGTSCTDQLIARFEDGDLSHLEDAIDGGTIVYHGDLVDDCIAELDGAGCTFMNPFELCEGVFEGTVADGGACQLNEECSGDAYCMISGACPGTCQARVGSGSTCTSSSACQAGLTCDGGTCRAPAGEGAACGGTTGVDCSGLFACVGDDTATAGVCTGFSTLFSGAEGELCDVQNDDFCDEGLSCAFDGLDGTTPRFRCVARVGAGADCTIAVPDMCPDGQFCSDTNIMTGDTMGTCAPLPSAGDDCTPALPVPRCAAGLVCVSGAPGSAGTCEVLGRVGDTCETGATCASGFCDGGTCQIDDPSGCP